MTTYTTTRATFTKRGTYRTITTHHNTRNALVLYLHKLALMPLHGGTLINIYKDNKYINCQPVRDLRHYFIIKVEEIPENAQSLEARGSLLFD